MHSNRLSSTTALPMSLGALGQFMPFGTDTVDGRFDARVEQFHHHQQYHGGRQQGGFDPGTAQPQRQGQKHKSSQCFLAEGGFTPGAAQTLQGIARGVPEAVQPLRVFWG